MENKKRIYKGQKLRDGQIVTKVYYYDYDPEDGYVIYELDHDIVTYGSFASQKESIPALQGECAMIRDLAHGKKTKAWINSQIAIGLREFLTHNDDKCEETFKNCIEIIKKKELARKKRIYIGVYLFAILIILIAQIWLTASSKQYAFDKYITISLFGAIGGFIALNTKLSKINFSIYETTWSYVLVAIYKIIFSCLSSIIVYFLIQGDLVLTALKDNTSITYVAASLGGFSETLLPNFFSGMEKDIINKE